MSTKRRLMLNASALKSSGNCILKLARVLQGAYDPVKYNDTEFGSAGHVGIESYELTGDPTLSTMKACNYFKKVSNDEDFVVRNKKDWMNIGYLINVMECFYQERENGEFSGFEKIETSKGELLVEKTFALKIFEGVAVEVYACGTIDCIERVGGKGVYLAADYKTTGQWNQWKFMKSFRLSPQLLLYVYALQELGRRYPGSIFEEMSTVRIGGQIRAIFLKPNGTVECKAGEVQLFSSEVMNNFVFGLMEICEKLDHFFGGTIPLPKEGLINDACKGVYGPCMFVEACAAPSSKAEKWFLSKIPMKEYEPLKFRKQEE